MNFITFTNNNKILSQNYEKLLQEKILILLYSSLVFGNINYFVFSSCELEFDFK